MGDGDEGRLRPYMAAWGLAEPRLLAVTATSHVYTVAHAGGEAALKLLAPGEVEERVGAVALAHFGGRGAVRLLRHDAGAHLLEYADGEELAALVARGEDRRATLVIAEVLAQLHGAPGEPPAGLVPLRRWFRALLERGAGADTIYARGAAVAERLLADQRDVRVLHGDIHHSNIRQSPRGWLAFDPKGLLGERTYDCANALCNPAVAELVHSEARLLASADILAGELGLDRARVLAFTYAYACLSAAWWEQEPDGRRRADWDLRIAELVEPHVLG